MKTLIFGYGNASRRDDGVGWFVIGQLDKLGLDGIELLNCHQLEVDHAEVISRFDNVIFVDATTPQSPRTITETVVQPRFQTHAVTHYLTPSDLLSLSDTLYGQVPRAILFSIRGCDFGFGMGLSSATEGWALEAVQRIQQLVVQSNRHPDASHQISEDRKGRQAHA
ncbi:MAG TPA: hydrogenase maturation protease [Verrucomicrobiae bacterium]|nr:hydrogenase maturation protease [Verrucomicrobiae bacterium]